MDKKETKENRFAKVKNNNFYYLIEDDRAGSVFAIEKEGVFWELRISPKGQSAEIHKVDN